MKLSSFFRNLGHKEILIAIFATMLSPERFHQKCCTALAAAKVNGLRLEKHIFLGSAVKSPTTSETNY